MYVEIDNDLAELLEQHMHLDETHQQIVNRLLRQAMQDRTATAGESIRASRTRVVRPGSMQDLLRAGLVKVGDELRYTEKRRGIVHAGSVTTDGRIATAGGQPTSPSTALGRLVGYEINGWKCWVHAPSGKTLSALRDGLSS